MLVESVEAVLMTCVQAIFKCSDSIEALRPSGVTLGICFGGALWATARSGVLVESVDAVLMTRVKAIFKCSYSVETLRPSGVPPGICFRGASWATAGNGVLVEMKGRRYCVEDMSKNHLQMQ